LTPHSFAGHYFNSIALCCPDGTIVPYRKNSPWPVPEVSWATAGCDLTVVDTPWGKLGLAICFDIHETVPCYRNERLWCLLYSIAWVDGAPLPLWFHTIMPGRNRLGPLPFHVIGANWTRLDLMRVLSNACVRTSVRVSVCAYVCRCVMCEF
jgi:hypothetical protein